MPPHLLNKVIPNFLSPVFFLCAHLYFNYVLISQHVAAVLLCQVPDKLCPDNLTYQWLTGKRGPNLEAS